MLKQTIQVITGILILTIIGCKDDAVSPTNGNGTSNLITEEFPEAQQEVMETFGAIAQSIKDAITERVVAIDNSAKVEVELDWAIEQFKDVLASM